MKQDTFSSFHPLINFIYFIGALGFSVVIQHPVYLLTGCIGALVYYLLLNGSKGVKLVLAILPLCILMAIVNPLFNHRGTLVLFHIFGNPYTLEALLYGCAVAGIFLVMMLWFGCYSAVMTGDKFTSLFGNLIPSLSLLLVMIFRMIPGLVRKAMQLSDSRRSIGKGSSETASYREKAADGMAVLGSLANWALEGSIVTADSMRSRGYGTAKRTSFTIYRMAARDWTALAFTILLGLAVLITAITGGTSAAYTPQLQFAPITGIYALGYGTYWVFCLFPTILHIKEAILWHISRSKI